MSALVYRHITLLHVGPVETKASSEDFHELCHSQLSDCFLLSLNLDEIVKHFKEPKKVDP